ncbi:thioesterase family protein [Nesterenkonia sp. MY13]|uniref:Thioesterase family protein n=1 Tax=Nesterenkonia sedimenti TaxID=1463632 RepID=A0A7X8TLY3_9MICC|nr:thioesterase family protein [Nesterenkonia sedimenti]NLS11133.1 thioesterase family protein [Nesterenkonia sedimenti]
MTTAVETETPLAYFIPLGGGRYRATEAVSGAWNEAEQHISSPLGLMVHAVEQEAAARRPDPLQLCRLSFDIFGTVPVGEVQIEIEVIRPGRTIELVEARMSYGEKTIVVLRAWGLAEFDTRSVEGSSLPGIPSPEQMPAWDASTIWPGGFIASTSGNRDYQEPGRSRAWIRSPLPLLQGEEASSFAKFCALLDTANGIAVRQKPEEVAFPNVDLTVSFFRLPEGEEVGFDTHVSFGPTGLGLTHTIVHDIHGPVGALTQQLTVRT